jgi:YVTN family beta-propeller protein
VIGLHGVGRQVKPGQALVLFAALCVSAALCRAASGAEAFITDQTGDEVSVLDLGTKHVVARIPVTGKPAGIAMARDGGTAYVTSPEGKYVSVIDTASRKITAKIAIPDTPLGIAARSFGRLYLCRQLLSAAPL